MILGLERLRKYPPVATGCALILLAAAYYAGAEAAFRIGTLSDRIFAPFWPPNIILFSVLLLTPERRWWLYVAAAFPAHVAAELGVGMAPTQYLVAFATNCAVAMLNAYGLRCFAGGADCFATFRQAATYVLVTVVAAPAIAAFGGAFVPLLSEGATGGYWVAWAHWYNANALADATLGPVLLTSVGATVALPRLTMAGRAEAAALLLGLAGACAIAFGASPEEAPGGFLPALLYLPVPFVVWAAIRFGANGASAAVLVVTIVSIWRNLHGATLLNSDDAEQNVLALQVFLIAFSVPVLLLGAAIEELRRARTNLQELAGSLLRTQDRERRHVARELHDRIGQNLAGANLIVRRLQGEAATIERSPIADLGNILQRSVRELRTISYLLHPPLLDEAGLGLALRAYVKGFSERSGIAVDLKLPPAMERFPQEVELAVFRVIQEALAGVCRNSESPAVRISLMIERKGHNRELAVAIDGLHQGADRKTHAFSRRDASLDPYDFTASGSRVLGLQRVSERVRQIGGRFAAGSGAHETVVSASVPLAD